MTIQTIKTDVIYNHEKYGDVLVTGIGEMYEEWNVDTRSGTTPYNCIVFFYDDYDGYGGMSPMPHSQPANEFSKLVTEKIGEHDYIDTDY